MTVKRGGGWSRQVQMLGAWQSCFPRSRQARMVQREHLETQGSLTEEGTEHLGAFEFSVPRKSAFYGRYSLAALNLLVGR